MNKLRFTLTLSILLAGKLLFAQSPALIKEYIAKYKDVAIEEMKRSGVPASITLAQGIHETVAGTSVLVNKSNNHFGIKCKSTWMGESVSHDDDARGECFRKYSSPVDSYKDHSDFLRNGSRYAFLFEYDPTDFESWAHGLKKAGYATNPKYPQILIKLIQDYQLQDYTLIAMGRKTDGPDVYWTKRNNPTPGVTSPVTTVIVNEEVAPPPAYPSSVFKINETKVVFVRKGTSYLSVAEEHEISLPRLFDFNDMQPQEIAEADQLIYLQRKRKSGNSDFHKVVSGETLHLISQAEGIRLESLLAYNFLEQGMQPEVGEVLYLRKQAPAMPRLAMTSAAVTIINSVSDNMAAAPIVNEPAFDDYTVHTVQPRETVYSISKKYAVSIDDVIKWNSLSSVEIKSGQQLRINKKSGNVLN